MRPIDADAYKVDLWVGSDYLDEDTLLTATNILDSQPTIETGPKWIPVEERKPADFVSVLGHMTDAGEFPSVRECYVIGQHFYFPALGEFHQVDKWREMPEVE